MLRGFPSARRWSLGVALSLAAHGVVVGGWAAYLLISGLSFDRGPVDVEITGMRLDEIHDLPLGARPAGAEPSTASARPKARRRAPKPPAPEAGQLATAAVAPDKEDKSGPVEAEDEAEGAPPQVKNVSEYGPEGSRLTVLLRTDRLRQTPYVQAVDGILRRLPDRADLLKGTGLDIYQAFDAILIATPNPMDDAVTFLAARHHLKDADMRSVLEAGARETGHVLTWRTEGRRPVAERRVKNAPPGAHRDDRLLILPAQGLIVVTPPVYRSLLLKPRPRPAAAGADAGAGGERDAGGDGAAADAGASPDAGAAGEREGWADLLRRIDAEDGVMPQDAIAMLSAVDLFNARGLQRGLTVPQHPRERPRDPTGAARAAPAMFMGLEIPHVLTIVAGVDSSPFLNVTAEFADEDQAIHWERSWPTLHQRLRLNPYVVLGGFSALVAAVELKREGSTIKLHLSASELDTMRVLELVPRLMGR